MAPWKYTDESYKEYTRTTWNESAQNYSKVLRWLEPYGFDLLARVDPKIHERALDIATGPGEPALSMARMVGPEGDVVGIDLSEKMIERATNGAKERRILNAAFRVMDAEKMDFPDDTFELAEPDETGYLPTPYELGGPGEMVKLLEDAGFSEAKEDCKTHSFVWKDEADYLETILGGTPLGHSLKEEDPPVQKKILARTRENLRKWRKGRSIEIPCECVIVTARK